MAAKPNEYSTSSKKSKKTEGNKQRKQFRWTDDMVEKLITCLHKFKSTMEYQNVDFDGDRTVQYSWLREEMARMFAAEDETLFGPVDVYSPDPEVPVTKMSQEEKHEYQRRLKVDKDNIKKAYARIKEKVKDIRQSFSHAVTTGRRSGSGKIVFEHFDRLVSLWGGSAGTEPLPFGVDGELFSSDGMDQDTDAGENNLNTLSHNTTSQQEEDSDDDQVHNIDNPGKDSQEGTSVGTKRKSESQVPRLIDNKRKHLQKSLSAAQRDHLLLNEAKEDLQYRKDLAEAMRQSTDSFSKALEGVSNSMLQIGAGLCRSLDVMAQAMISPQPVNQNLFYQNQQVSANHRQYPGQNLYGHSESNYPREVSSCIPSYGGSGIPHAFQTDENPDDNTRYHSL